jgi:hypothetical protein
MSASQEVVLPASRRNADRLERPGTMTDLAMVISVDTPLD